MAPAKNSAISLSDDEEILSLVILKVSKTIALCKNFVTNGWSKNLFFLQSFCLTTNILSSCVLYQDCHIKNISFKLYEKKKIKIHENSMKI